MSFQQIDVGSPSLSNLLRSIAYSGLLGVWVSVLYRHLRFGGELSKRADMKTQIVIVLGCLVCALDVRFVSMVSALV